MYTLLIADDEPLIRNGVKKIIDWESLGFSEIFLAEDGQEALDIIRKNHVDLVLTDIVMPFMDGLELTEILSREFPQIHVVILTGHEDFQYAQKSVGLGVKNYILKPIGAESLYKEMKEICEKLHIENSQRQYIQSMKNQLRQSLPVLQEQTLNKIVCSADRNLRLYLERAKSLQLDMSQAPYEIGVMDLDMENISGADYDLYLFASRNIVKECLGKEHYVFEDGKDRVVILFRCGTLEAESHDLIYDVLCIIQKSIYNTIRLKTTCALGTTAATLDELNQAFEDLALTTAIQDMLIEQDMHAKGCYDFDEETENWIQAQGQTAYETALTNVGETLRAELGYSDEEDMSSFALSYAKALGVTVEDYIAVYRKQRAMVNYYTVLLGDNPVTEDAIQSAYETNVAASKERFEGDAAAFETALYSGKEVWYKIGRASCRERV